MSNDASLPIAGGPPSAALPNPSTPATGGVTIRVRDNGSLFVEGPVTIVDAEGKSFTLTAGKPGVGLCRCGLSQRKPFCDGAHKGKFESCVRAAGLDSK